LYLRDQRRWRGNTVWYCLRRCQDSLDDNSYNITWYRDDHHDTKVNLVWTTTREEACNDVHKLKHPLPPHTRHESRVSCFLEKYPSLLSKTPFPSALPSNQQGPPTSTHMCLFLLGRHRGNQGNAASSTLVRCRFIRHCFGALPPVHRSKHC
jgi:hypothetical protein